LVGIAGLAGMIYSLLLLKFERWDGRFLPVAINRRDRWRVFYLFNFFLSLAAMEATLCMPWVYNLHPPFGVYVGSYETFVLASFSLGIGALLVLLNTGKITLSLALLLSLATYVVGLGIWWKASTLSQDSAGLFFRLRAVELRIGSSPALPILAALFALALFCYVHMHRIYLAACQEPFVVTNFETALKERLCTHRQSLRRHLRSRLGLVRGIEWIYVVVVFLIAYIMGFSPNPIHKLSGVDGWPFNFLLVALQVVLLAALLQSCVQMSVLWLDLRSFLAALGTLPLADFFIARSKAQTNRPIWVQSLNLQSLSTLVRGPLVLHDMARLADQPVREMYEQYRDAIIELFKYDQSAKRSDLLRRNRAASAKNLAITRTMLSQSILPHWRGTPLVGKVERADEKQVERDPAGQLGIRGEPSQIPDLAQTFVALHFTPFLLYCVKQIRSLIWFLSLGFVALALSMNADSPQSPQLISRFLLVLFVVIATVLWRCLAGIERDPIISRIEGTKAGELNVEFYFKIVGYVALPVLGLLASEFPSIANFLLSWVEPTLTAVK